MSPESVSSERIGADLEATAAAVLTLRFWMQPRDGIKLGEIVALYNELPVDEDIILWVNTNYGDHLRRMDGSQHFEVEVDGVKLTQRVLLKTFVYGGFAHANDDKRKLYEQLISPPMKAFMEGMFEAAMCDFLRFVFWLAKMNEHSIPALEKIVAGDPDKTVIYFR